MRKRNIKKDLVIRISIAVIVLIVSFFLYSLISFYFKKVKNNFGKPIYNFDQSTALYKDQEILDHDISELYLSYGISYGIDVSEWQGKIDWEEVANTGISFAIIRCGFRGINSSKIYEDANFKENIEGAIASGLKVGVYFFGTAKTTEEAIEESEFVMNLIKDYKLSRYICYLIVQNADSSKEVVALGQTYFAVQTRKQELLEEYNLLPEDDKRLKSRKEIRTGNRTLSITAINAGVKNLDKFHNAGYKGLYNGETADDIAKRKKLRYREEILDNMGSDELAANLFRISQINQKLIRDNIKGEKDSNSAHYEVGKKVRKAIADIGGIMPEDMPLPNKSLKAIEKKNNNVELTKVK